MSVEVSEKTTEDFFYPKKQQELMEALQTVGQIKTTRRDFILFMALASTQGTHAILSSLKDRHLSAEREDRSLDYAACAELTFQAMQENFRRKNLINDEIEIKYLNGPYYNEEEFEIINLTKASAWPLSMAMAGVVDLANLKKDNPVYVQTSEQMFKGFNKYWNSDVGAYEASIPIPIFQKNHPIFFDDNAWIGLDFLRFFELVKDNPDFTKSAIDALVKAGKILDFVHKGIGSQDGCVPGALPWQYQNTGVTNRDKGTVANASNALLALKFYELTEQVTDRKEEGYLKMAKDFREWINENMQDQDGLYKDHYTGSCAEDDAKRTYNQGLMVEVNARLYKITGEKEYLQEAFKIADTSLKYYGDNYFLHDPAFNAVFFRSLLYLSSIEGADQRLKRAVIHAMENYAKRVWYDKSIHDRKSGLFSFTKGKSRFIDQGAMLQIFAMLAKN